MTCVDFCKTRKFSIDKANILNTNITRTRNMTHKSNIDKKQNHKQIVQNKQTNQKKNNNKVNKLVIAHTLHTMCLNDAREHQHWNLDH